MKLVIIPLFLILYASQILFAQEGVAINNANANPDVSALLDVSSTSKGVLIPRMTEVNKNAILTPAQGLLVYQTDGTIPGFYYYDGSAWIALSNSGLEIIDEGSQGWRFIGANPNNYGNIGLFAQDLSYSNTASTAYGATGDYAFASGYQTIASGVGSVAMGYETVANTSHATAMGIRSTSSGFYSFAIGNNNTAAGTAAISMGDNNDVSSNYGVAIGRNHIVSQTNAAALGYNNTASGNTSTAIGYNTTASGENATATGRYTTASGAYSTAMGHMTTAKSGYEMVVGRYNTDYTPANLSGWTLQDRLFVVGNGSGPTNTSNALIIYKDGRININDAYTLPIADGTANQFIMTNGAGSLTWSSSSTTGLEEINEGSLGWRFVGANPNNYGDIGEKSVDLSHSSAASSTYGATGNYSFASGRFTTASGNHSTSMGRLSVASGIYSTAMGYDTKATGPYSTSAGYSSEASGTSSTAIGRFALARSYGETAIGIYNTDYTPSSITGYSPSDRIFVVGNGTSTTLSNALTIYKDGRMNINDAYTMPTVDGGANQVLTTDGSGTISWSSIGTSTDDQNISGSGLSGTTLTIGIEGGANETVDLSSLQDGTGTDDQILTLNGTNLSIESGNAVDLSSLITDGDWTIDSSGNMTNANSGAVDISVDATINGHNIGRGSGNLASNTVFGADALANNTTGAYNSIFGNNVMENAFSNNTYNATLGYYSMAGPVGGFSNTSFNVAIGAFTLSNINGGDYNVANGYASLYSNTIGSYNQASGSFSLYENLNGTANIASGYYSMHHASTGNDYNIATGYNSMRGTANYTNSDNNIAFGYASLFSISGGDYNVAIGYRTLHENTGGSHNHAMGQNALFYNSNGSYNFASGNQALYFATTGNDYNIALGSNAMKGTAAFTGSDYNIAIGVFSLSKISGGDYNIALGRTALEETTSGTGNIALGHQTLNTNTTGSFNTAVGYNADIATAVDLQGVAITNATAIGHDALVDASNKIQLGDTYVTSVETSGQLTTGAVTYPNVDGASGQVLVTNGAGTASWATPVDDGDWNFSGSNMYNANSGNVGIGTASPSNKLHVEGGGSTAVRINSSGGTSNYSLIAHNSGGSAAKFQTGGSISGYTSANTAISAMAYGSGSYGIFASSDDGVGVLAQSQGSSPALDAWAFGSGLAGYFRGGDVHIEEKLGIGDATPDGKLEVRQTGTGDIFNLYDNTTNVFTVEDGGEVGIGTVFPNSKLHINNPSTATGAHMRVQDNGSTMFVVANNGNTALYFNDAPAYKLQLNINSAAKPTSSTWTVTSDARLKTDVAPFKDGLNVLMSINPIWFNYNGEAGMPTDERGVGTIAQELQKIAPYMVNEWTYTEGSLDESKSKENAGFRTTQNYLGVDYGAMDFIMINSIQEQQEIIEDQSEKISKQKEEIENLKKQMKEMQQTLKVMSEK